MIQAVSMGSKDVRVRHAEKLGVEPERVELVRLQLAKLAEDGTLVDIDAIGLSRFTRRLSWEDLGVKPPAGKAIKFTPGQNGLIPNRYLAPMESAAHAARQALEDLSFDITGFQPYRWVPFLAWKEWRRRFTAADAELQKAKDAILADYDAIRDEMAQAFERMARDAALRYRAVGQEVPDEWIESVVKRYLGAMPSREDVEAVRLIWRPGMLVRDSQIQEEMLEVSRIEAKREAIQARKRLELEEIDSRQRQLTLAEEMVRRNASEELEAKRRMRDEAMRRYREQLKEMAFPFQEAWDQLRARVYEDAIAIAESIKKNGYLRGKTAQRAVRVARTFRLLDSQDDAELAGLLGQLEKMATAPIPKRSRKRELAPINSILDEISRLTHASALEMRRRLEPSRFKALEL
ncbi:MAG: hypothetical protein M1343_10270 [Chloroflexi bacterium]|nr:hypothetical protein [Chloroflexota bacterium]MDA8186968.1 hypothetical protein [Dehalococcoidales bacterium]